MSQLILPATESDLSEILRLAKGLDLDIVDISWKQFVVAKKGNRIIGIGRLREYPECTEVATVGVTEPERHKGIGTALVNELIRTGPAILYVACVIPEFFLRFGFEKVKQYPPVLQKKVDFCKLYDFKDEQIFIMKISR